MSELNKRDKERGTQMQLRERKRSKGNRDIRVGNQVMGNGLYEREREREENNGR